MSTSRDFSHSLEASHFNEKAYSSVFRDFYISKQGGRSIDKNNNNVNLLWQNKRVNLLSKPSRQLP